METPFKRKMHQRTQPTKKKKLNEKTEFESSSIYITKLSFVENPPSHMLAFKQLFLEDLKSSFTAESTLLTTFCFEETFIAPLIQKGIKTCLVCHSNRKALKRVFDHFTLVSPSVQESWGKFHAKLCLVKFPSTLRVVVMSANLVSYDWNSIGQVVWFQDFPTGVASGEFYQELSEFVSSILPNNYNLAEELGIHLERYDYSQAKVQLVSSVPGRHKNTLKYGQGRLRNLLRNSNKSFNNLTLQCSSIGNINPSMQKEYCLSFANNQDANFEIIFPSVETVRNSHLGLEGGGTTFLKESHYNAPKFPRESFRDLAAPETFPQVCNHLSHSKVIVAHNNYEYTDDTLIYIGSHNLSMAAWGKFEKQCSQLFIANYELGVVFMPETDSSATKNEVVSKIPFKIPGDSYEGKSPWIINKHLS